MIALLALTLLAAPAGERAEHAYRAGQYADAAAAFGAAAEAADTDAEEAWWTARQGLALGKTEQYAEAAVLLEVAVEGLDRAGEPVRAARARRYLARVLQMSGRAEAAARTLAAAEAVFARLGLPGDRAATAIARGHLELAAGEAGSAYALYARALEDAAEARDIVREQTALTSMGRLLFDLGDDANAGWLLDQAVTLARLVGDVPREALALTAAALADLRLGACEGAAARLDAAAPLLGQYAALRRQHALTHILVALDCGATEDAARRLAEAARQGWDRGWLAPQFALAAGRVARLQGDLDAARTHLGPLLGHHDALVRAEAHGQLGEALLAAGRSEPADAHLARWSAARRQYIEGGGPLSRARFMSADHVARVGRWARARADRGDIAGALDALSALQSMAFLEALMARVRGAVPRPAAGAWIDAFVSAAGPGTPRSAGRLLDDLPPEVAVLLPYPLESETFVFLAWRRAGGSPRVVLERVPAGRAELARRVARLRARLQSGQAGFETDASWLAARLVEPVASTLASTGARSLAVIPHGPLHDLPFAMLPSGGVPLVDRVPVFDAPSLPALIALVAPGVAPDAPTRPLVVADAAGDLPGARRNARALGVALPGASVLVGADARVGRVLPALAHADLVHFAVHGHHARTGGPGWLALADGALDADRVASARLRGAPLVVLASCETGQGEPAPADDVPGVLDRAFLAAGARAVVSTRWRIDDGSAARFFQAFYAARSGRTLVDALASAQRAVRDMTAPADVVGRRTRGLIPRAPTAGPERLDHPYHWAGFRLMGDPR